MQCAVQAAWWVEYVCRHQGARWLRGVEEDVPYYQVRKESPAIFFYIYIFFLSLRDSMVENLLLRTAY